jgi:pimeloyl-ACP methyl ester carboxylesterase
MEIEPLSFEKVEILGVKLELWRRGSGRPLVFLHPGDGLGFCVEALQGLAERYQVFAPSHPGFGGSDLPEAFTTVDDLAYFYLDFLAAFDIVDAILVGVSFGGWIAAEIATKCTDRIAAVVLADALGAKFGDRLTREIADLFSVPQYDQARLLYADGRKIDYSAYSDEELMTFARNHHSFAHFAWSPTLHNPKLRQRLHRIDVPTLVLWGDRDKVVPLDYGRRFAETIPNARFEVIEDAGHYPQTERVNRFVAAIDNFSNGLPQKAT